jgi:hypothetical protein
MNTMLIRSTISLLLLLMSLLATASNSCPNNSSLKDERCMCNDGYQVAVDGSSCVVLPIYSVEEVLEYITKVQVCSDDGYISNSVAESLRFRVQFYSQNYIEKNDKERLEIKSKVMLKRTSSLWGIGCESAYNKLMKLPKAPWDDN